MAMYYCYHCDDLKDDDWHPACEHPLSKTFERYIDQLVCPDCEQEILGDMEEALLEDKYDPNC